MCYVCYTKADPTYSLHDKEDDLPICHSSVVGAFYAYADEVMGISKNWQFKKLMWNLLKALDNEKESS